MQRHPVEKLSHQQQVENHKTSNVNVEEEGDSWLSAKACLERNRSTAETKRSNDTQEVQ